VKVYALVGVRLLSYSSRQLTGQLRRAVALLVISVFSMVPVAPASYAATAPAKARATFDRDGVDHDSDGCNLKSARGDIKHVIYIQFDNVHFRRDNPNVPSDLEQMPHLRDFLTDNGTILTNHYTPLIPP
jgi:hypothetical protein